MALGDKQVLSPSVAAGASDYLIPGAVSLQLKAVSAEFVDNGAGGDWLPAVVAISDSGHVFWRAADQGVKVTAGDDAEVSWFPGVKHAAAAAAATGVEWFWAKRELVLAVNAGTHKNVPWVSSKTSDPTLFSLINGHGVANDTIQVARPGITLTTCYCNPTAPANWKIELLLNGDNEVPLGSAGSNWLTDANADNTPAALHNNPRDTRTSVGIASPFNLYAQIFNLDVGNHTVDAFYIGVGWWPNPTLWA